MRPANRLRAGIAGVVAVAVTLGALELAAGLLASVPSLVSSVGELFIPLTPPPVKDWAIETFGTTDKAVLTVGVAMVSLLVGAVAGVGARSDPRRFDAVVGGFAALGLFAAAQTPGISLPLTAVLTVFAAVGGAAAFHGLRGAAARAAHDGEATPTEEQATATVARRQFVAGAAGGVVAAAAAGGAGRALLIGSSGSAVPDDLALPAPRGPAPSPSDPASFEIPDLASIVTPNDDFYRIDTALQVPRVDVDTWTLRVTGMVDRELELTYADLRDRQQIEEYVTLACVSNDVGGGLVGNAAWQGTPLAPLLEEAGVADGATQVVGRAVDGFTVGFPTELALDGRPAMVAIGMNGEPLPAPHGFPARLIVPGLYGYVSATKWLSEIELTTFEGFDAYWIPRGWAKRGPIKTQSRIDVPADGRRVEPGPRPVAGVAWAPTRGISRVEISVDQGEWQECELSTPISDLTWVQWRTEVDVDGPTQIAVRATDGTGQTQTERTSDPRPDGATGYHMIRVFT